MQVRLVLLLLEELPGSTSVARSPDEIAGGSRSRAEWRLYGAGIDEQCGMMTGQRVDGMMTRTTDETSILKSRGR